MYIVALFVIAVCLLLISRRSLKLAYVLFAALLLLAVVFYFIGTPNLSRQSNSAEQAFKQSINLSSPELSLGYAGRWKLSAEIENQHESKILRSVLVQSSVKDCAQKAKTITGECQTIKEEDNFLEVRILPKQSKGIQINLGMQHDAHSPESWVWTHEIIQVK